MLLQAIEDLKTLGNLIIASRAYHGTFRAHRNVVAPALILDKIAKKGIFIGYPISWMEYCVDLWHPLSNHVDKAISLYYEQSRKGSTIHLDFEECLPLLALKDVRTWTGRFAVYQGGQIFPARPLRWMDSLHYAPDGEYRLLGLDSEPPAHLLLGQGSPPQAW